MTSKENGKICHGLFGENDLALQIYAILKRRGLFVQGDPRFSSKTTIEGELNLKNLAGEILRFLSLHGGCV